MNKKILGMGNAVLDIVTSVTDDYLKSKKLSKGSMVLVDQKISDQILNEIKPIKKDSGGSVANTIVGISLLGNSSYFCGKVKNDKLGDDFVSDMKETETIFLCNQSLDGLPTARCIVFVTPDGERSMQTFLGASTTLSEHDVQESFFSEIDYLLIEGYLWSSEIARKSIEKAVAISLKKGIKIVFSLSDSNLVKMYRKDFKVFIKSNVNILIGNEDEFEVLFSDEEDERPQKLLNTEIIVKTKGKDGAEIYHDDGKKEHVNAVKVESVKDTTGAGDMFAAGFLFKILKGESPIEAAKFGCKSASLIIQQFGARPSLKILKNIFGE